MAEKDVLKLFDSLQEKADRKQIREAILQARRD